MTNRPAGMAFDCYGTLLRLTSGLDVTQRFARLAKRTPGPSPMIEDISLEEALLLRGVDAATAEAIGAGSRRALLLRGVDAATAEAIGADAIAEAAGAEPIEGVMDALARLRDASIPYVIVSNLSREYAEPISRWFPTVPTVLSFSMGCAKPSGTMYEAARTRLGVEGRVLMVGDSRRCDHDGARDAGMDAVLLSPVDVDGIRCARGVADVVARFT